MRMDIQVTGNKVATRMDIQVTGKMHATNHCRAMGRGFLHQIAVMSSRGAPGLAGAVRATSRSDF